MKRGPSDPDSGAETGFNQNLCFFHFEPNWGGAGGIIMGKPLLTQRDFTRMWVGGVARTTCLCLSDLRVFVTPRLASWKAQRMNFRHQLLLVFFVIYFYPKLFDAGTGKAHSKLGLPLPTPVLPDNILYKPTLTTSKPTRLSPSSPHPTIPYYSNNKQHAEESLRVTN